MEMKQLLIDGIIHCSWTGPTPDWAKDAEHRATIGVGGYVLRTVAHGDYLEGERADEWDETTGKRKVERPVKTPEQLDAEASAEAERIEAEMSEHLAYLASTDWYAVRFAETGEKIPPAIMGIRQASRNRISEIRELLKTEW